MIITNILDLDWYKLTMMQFAHRYYPNVRVKSRLKNRTKKVPLARIIDIGHLREELEGIRMLKPTISDIEYLQGKTGKIPSGFFSDEFINYFSKFQMSDFNLDVDSSGDQFVIEPEGTWADEILWETFLLSTVNELFYKYAYKDDYERLGRIELLESRGVPRLKEKVQLLKQYPDIKYVEFGTRRRFEKQWQLYVNMYLRAEAPQQYLGSSNVFVSRIMGQMPIGTMAHELFMVLAGLHSATDEGIVESFDILIQQWFEMYGESLSVVLTDTFGTDFFFRKFGPYAKKWKGLRQDSGDPFVFGDKAIKFYQELGIDPLSKSTFFSDGLDPYKMIHIRDHFSGRTNFGFGVGTNFTNDVGYPTLSIVVKAVEANGNHLVKLSDNLAKAVGDEETVARYKRVHGYTNENSEECVV